MIVTRRNWPPLTTITSLNYPGVIKSKRLALDALNGRLEDIKVEKWVNRPCKTGGDIWPSCPGQPTLTNSYFTIFLFLSPLAVREWLCCWSCAMVMVKVGVSSSVPCCHLAFSAGLEGMGEKFTCGDEASCHSAHTGSKSTVTPSFPNPNRKVKNNYLSVLLNAGSFIYCMSINPPPLHTHTHTHKHRLSRANTTKLSTISSGN